MGLAHLGGAFFHFGDKNLSANIELALLTRVMEEGDFHSLEKAQLNESFFMTSEAREVYRFLREIYHHPSTSGQVPTIDFGRYRFPSLYLSAAPEPVSILCQHLRQEKVKMELLTLAQNITERAHLDPLAAIAELRSKSAEITSMSEVGEDLSMAGTYQMLLDNYTLVQQAGGILGIPYPWAALNEETQGMQGSQFIVIFGRPKSMKSWLGIYIGVHAYLASRRRVLFYTREMNPKLVAGRVACCMAGVDYKSFKNGKLQPELRERVFRILNELSEDEQALGQRGYRQPYFIITSDRSAKNAGSGGGVGWLQAKIREMQPDLVVVDGMYLMKDDRTNQRTIDWKQIAHISQDLKLTCQDFDIPLIGITQANRNAQKSKGDDLTELAFSDALGQDADAVFRTSKVEKLDESGIKRTYLYIKAPGLREGKFDGMVLHGEPATDFSYIRTMVAADEEEEYGDSSKRSNSSSNGAPAAQRRPTFMRPPTDPRISNAR